MLEILISGKLRGIPEAKRSASGKDYCRFRVSVPTADGDLILASVIAFSETATRVQALTDGDAVSIAGSAKLTHWTGRRAKSGSVWTWWQPPFSRLTPPGRNGANATKCQTREPHMRSLESRLEALEAKHAPSRLCSSSSSGTSFAMTNVSRAMTTARGTRSFAGSTVKRTKSCSIGRGCWPRQGNAMERSSCCRRCTVQWRPLANDSAHTNHQGVLMHRLSGNSKTIKGFQSARGP